MKGSLNWSSISLPNDNNGGSVIEHNIFQTHETTSGIYRENNTLSTCSSTPFKSKNNDDSESNEQLEDSLNINGIFCFQPPTQLSISTPKKNKRQRRSFLQEQTIKPNKMTPN
ncbi:unnamed protein product [Macrosiphum euphorbiae]|uniref:Uncharacterized protein n=1 Tax=Macrosiphum euphorbiae TaxID=13131 RepID=A0AAV0WSE9_9HEMI|nr:unnamed protein product [Macrosiphum euphorbiae]